MYLPATSSSSSVIEVLDAEIRLDLYATSAYCSSKTVVVQLLHNVFPAPAVPLPVFPATSHLITTNIFKL